MSDSIEVREPVGGTELFVEPVGERRLPFELLVEVEMPVLEAFRDAVKSYMEAHPKLEVVILDSRGSNEMIIRWRWRG
jgi:hypothetical protein